MLLYKWFRNASFFLSSRSVTDVLISDPFVFYVMTPYPKHLYAGFLTVKLCLCWQLFFTGRKLHWVMDSHYPPTFTDGLILPGRAWRKSDQWHSSIYSWLESRLGISQSLFLCGKRGKMWAKLASTWANSIQYVLKCLLNQEWGRQFAKSVMRLICKENRSLKYLFAAALEKWIVRN